MSTVGTGKLTRAQRRAAARKNKRNTRVVQPVIVEPIASGQGKAIKAWTGYSVSKWTASCAAAEAKATSAITISLPNELSSERNKQLKVGRVLLWLGLLPSVSGTVKSCVTETQTTAAASFQVALAVADNSKDVVAAMYPEAFKGITLEQLAADLTIYLYSSAALTEGDVIVHLEVEHVRPTFDDSFTPVY
uniref:Coat protein n=1 Tax=Cowpea chlorotic mottle virus TaxID=12303 RepID=Q8BEM4_CCMV|nr:coat protein [Cowpea chlorotic mottle virus]